MIFMAALSALRSRFFARRSSSQKELHSGRAANCVFNTRFAAKSKDLQKKMFIMIVSKIDTNKDINKIIVNFRRKRY